MIGWKGALLDGKDFGGLEFFGDEFSVARKFAADAADEDFANAGHSENKRRGRTTRIGYSKRVRRACTSNAATGTVNTSRKNVAANDPSPRAAPTLRAGQRLLREDVRPGRLVEHELTYAA